MFKKRLCKSLLVGCFFFSISMTAHAGNCISTPGPIGTCLGMITETIIDKCADKISENIANRVDSRVAVRSEWSARSARSARSESAPIIRPINININFYLPEDEDLQEQAARKFKKFFDILIKDEPRYLEICD